MTFEDLPPDWKDRPLDDPEITADVLDLFVSYADRIAGAAAVLLCTEDGRLFQPMVVPDASGWTPRRDKCELLDRLAGIVREAVAPDRASILFAVARETGIFVTDSDREWHEALLGACRRSGVRSLGMWIVTCGAIRALPQLPPVERSA